MLWRDQLSSQLQLSAKILWKDPLADTRRQRHHINRRAHATILWLIWFHQFLDTISPLMKALISSVTLDTDLPGVSARINMLWRIGATNLIIAIAGRQRRD